MAKKVSKDQGLEDIVREVDVGVQRDRMAMIFDAAVDVEKLGDKPEYTLGSFLSSLPKQESRLFDDFFSSIPLRQLQKPFSEWIKIWTPESLDGRRKKKSVRKAAPKTKPDAEESPSTAAASPKPPTPPKRAPKKTAKKGAKKSPKKGRSPKSNGKTNGKTNGKRPRQQSLEGFDAKRGTRAETDAFDKQVISTIGTAGPHGCTKSYLIDELKCSSGKLRLSLQRLKDAEKIVQIGKLKASKYLLPDSPQPEERAET